MLKPLYDKLYFNWTNDFLWHKWNSVSLLRVHDSHRLSVVMCAAYLRYEIHTMIIRKFAIK
jgi:hypothetical protein